MTKTSIDSICETLIKSINEKAGTSFETTSKDKTHAIFDCKGMSLVIDIHFEYDQNCVSKITYTLTDDGKTYQQLSLAELISLLEKIMTKDVFECCFCKKMFRGYGNNPAPVSKTGRCCNECNVEIVIPARMKEIMK